MRSYPGADVPARRLPDRASSSHTEAEISFFFHGKKVLKSTLFDGCDHFFTTRDMILHSGTRDDFVKSASDGVDFLLENFNLGYENLYRVKQVHSANVEIACKNNHLYENGLKLFKNSN